MSLQFHARTKDSSEAKSITRPLRSSYQWELLILILEILKQNLFSQTERANPDITDKFSHMKDLEL